MLVSLKRIFIIIKVLLQHGIDQFIFQSISRQLLQPSSSPPYQTLTPNKHQTMLFWWLRHLLFWIKNRYPEQPDGERLRLALQTLGPVWIKLGQMLSTRRDLLPDHIADPLALLQDQVAPFDGSLAKKQIEQALGYCIEERFDCFELKPLASASVAQVHCARLKETQQEVVLKIIRPDIRPIIDQDLQLMFLIARSLNFCFPQLARYRLIDVIVDYQQTLISELDLNKEGFNATLLRKNFKGQRVLYIPKVYAEFTRENLLVSERIYGIQVSDLATLKANGTNMKLLAQRGVDVFFTQVFRDNFFHADMHPGNVFVSYDHPEDPQWIGLDCGIMGTLNDQDKRYLAGNLLGFFNQDYRQVAQLHIDSGWVPEETDVTALEMAIRRVCEPLFDKPLSQISFGHVLVQLFQTARSFQMQVQPQLVLLEKTLLYVEGLGRQLYPELNLWETAKPYLENWVAEQSSPAMAFKKIKQKLPLWLEQAPELPELFFSHLSEIKALRQSLDQSRVFYANHSKQRQRQFLLTLISSISLLSSALFYINENYSLSIILLIAGVLLALRLWFKAS